MLQDEPDPVAGISPLFDAQAARTQAICTAARMNARPRVERDFMAGGDLSATGEHRSMSREFVVQAVAGMEHLRHASSSERTVAQ